MKKQFVVMIGLLAGAYATRGARVGLDEHPFPGGVAMTKDPVCGMAVDEKTAAATASYEGRTYHFCSAACKSKFEKEPRKYAERAGKP